MKEVKQSQITDIESLPTSATCEDKNLYAASFFDAEGNVIGFIFLGANSEDEAHEKIRDSSCQNKAASYVITKISKPKI